MSPSRQRKNTGETLAADRLHALYVDELRESLLPAGHPTVNRRQIEALIGRARTAEAAKFTEPDAATWIWSDLHLSHEQSRRVFGRPFRTAAAADEAMMNAWYEQVADDETIICLGDITVDGEALAHHQEWWRDAPGAKWLVLGNHDVDPVNQIRPFEIDHTAVTLYAAGDPPLLLTHVPLLQVPHGAVNVHGHVHEQESPTPNRHVNVSVEQLNYRPARLSEIRRLARRSMEGRTVAGHTTRARLNGVTPDGAPEGATPSVPAAGARAPEGLAREIDCRREQATAEAAGLPNRVERRRLQRSFPDCSAGRPGTQRGEPDADIARRASTFHPWRRDAIQPEWILTRSVADERSAQAQPKGASRGSMIRCSTLMRSRAGSATVACPPIRSTRSPTAFARPPNTAITSQRRGYAPSWPASRLA